MNADRDRLPGLQFRQSGPEDRAAIRAVETRAFGRPDEADLSAALLAGPTETLSLVAEEERRILGHLLFSRLEGADRALALAPLAVDPDFQRRHIGSGLVRQGLELARMRGWRAVFVLGEPDYYGRFGFRSELAAGADVPWRGPYFQALGLVDGALAGWSGELTYAEPFSRLE